MLLFFRCSIRWINKHTHAHRTHNHQIMDIITFATDLVPKSTALILLSFHHKNCIPSTHIIIKIINIYIHNMETNMACLYCIFCGGIQLLVPQQQQQQQRLQYQPKWIFEWWLSVAQSVLWFAYAICIQIISTTMTHGILFEATVSDQFENDMDITRLWLNLIWSENFFVQWFSRSFALSSRTVD